MKYLLRVLNCNEMSIKCVWIYNIMFYLCIFQTCYLENRLFTKVTMDQEFPRGKGAVKTTGTGDFLFLNFHDLYS